MSGLTVGQTLLFVSSDRSREAKPFDVVVKKVGRKWAFTNSGHKLDIETLVADGGAYSSPGKAWLSQDEYDRHKALTEAWARFRQLVDREHRCPVSDIEAIRNALAVLEMSEGPL